jgi:Zn finger protein HypA/HybF involved in hydrogenase expression
MDQEIIEYIRKNISELSRHEMSINLGISNRKVGSIIRTKNNNIVDERVYRYCPECKKKIFYENKQQRIKNENFNYKCTKCGAYDRSGEKNPFFGKHHTDEMKIFYHETHKGKRYSPSTEFKKGCGGSLVSNHESWTKKYGKQVADEKQEAFKNKISKIFSGEGNPMYGKPAPIGSGNGWSGWYKGWYFRSLLELSYMIFVIERFNIKWESGESKKNRIEYLYDGVIKNYFPDFILNEKYVIECKPKKLQKTEINKIKMEYAKIYCESNGLVLKMRDCRKIKKNELIELYKSGNIKFIEKYELKINEIIP